MKRIHRIVQIIEKYKLNNSKFERMASISNGYIAKQFKTESDVGESILVKILECFREINPDWLILGEGPMFRPKNAENAVSSVSEPSAEYKNNETLTILKAALEDKQEIIELLKEKIKKLEDKLNR